MAIWDFMPVLVISKIYIFFYLVNQIAVEAVDLESYCVMRTAYKSRSSCFSFCFLILTWFAKGTSVYYWVDREGLQVVRLRIRTYDHPENFYTIPSRSIYLRRLFQSPSLFNSSTVTLCRSLNPTRCIFADRRNLPVLIISSPIKNQHKDGKWNAF